MNYQDTLSRALLILKRREHAVNELHIKLVARGANPEVVAEVISKCVEENWLSDDRYADHYVQVKANQGWGPLYITYKLSQLKVSSSIYLDKMDGIDWVDCCYKLCVRKGYCLDDNKNIKRLLLRGYSIDIIKQVEHKLL